MSSINLKTGENTCFILIKHPLQHTGIWWYILPGCIGFIQRHAFPLQHGQSKIIFIGKIISNITTATLVSLIVENHIRI